MIGNDGDKCMLWCKKEKKQQKLSYMNFYVKRPSAVMRDWEKSYPKLI